MLTVADIAGLVVEVAFLGDLDGELRLGACGRRRGVGDGLAQARLAVGGAALREVGHGLATAGRGVHSRILGRRQAADERVHVPAGRPRFLHTRHRHQRRHQHHHCRPAALPSRHHLRPHPLLLLLLQIAQQLRNSSQRDLDLRCSSARSMERIEGGERE
jgi:hypothetical protein